jgi:hypothetical protein
VEWIFQGDTTGRRVVMIVVLVTEAKGDERECWL